MDTICNIFIWYKTIFYIFLVTDQYIILSIKMQKVDFEKNWI